MSHKLTIKNLTYLQVVASGKTFATSWKLANESLLSGVCDLMVGHITSADRLVLTSGP